MSGLSLQAPCERMRPENLLANVEKVLEDNRNTLRESRATLEQARAAHRETLCEDLESASLPKTLPLSSTYESQSRNEILLRPKKFASNYNSKDKVDRLYVNGITLQEGTTQDQNSSCKVPGHQVVANTHGQSIWAVFNRKGRSMVGDVLRGIGGLLSKTLGKKVERESVQSVLKRVKSLEGNSRKLSLIGYSQGVIITNNALWLAASELGPERFSKIASRIKVEGYGLNISAWPKGIQATLYCHSGDLVAKGSGWFSGIKKSSVETGRNIKQGAKSLWARTKAWWNDEPYEPPKPPQPSYSTAKIVRMDYNAKDDHQIETYMRHKPELFLAKHNNGRTNKDVNGMVSDLVQSINSGSLSDEVHRRIIGLMSGNEYFVSKLRQVYKGN